MNTGFWFPVLVLVAANAAADDSSSKQVYAKPVDRSAPRYPSSELRRRQQGWVELNYVVTKEGEVVEPVVEASSGSRAFERAALNTVKNWRYEPAMLNGEPIQQCKTAVRISFALDGAQSEVSRNFYRKYRKIDKILAKGEIDSASAELEKAFELTLGELSWLWALQARLAGLQEDREQQLVAVRRALAVSKDWIPDKLRSGLLTTRVVLELQQNNFAAALDAYADLQAIDSANTANLDPIIQNIRGHINGNELLVSTAVIGGDGSCESCSSQWRYQPMRRAIEIADVEGTLGNLELRCEWQRFVDKARENVAWSIPESWGDCSVVVFGETGSTFKLVELPDA